MQIGTGPVLCRVLVDLATAILVLTNYAARETGDAHFEERWCLTKGMLWTYLAIFLAMCLHPAPALKDY